MKSALSGIFMLVVAIIPAAQASELSTKTNSNFIFFGQTQGAGTPNELGIGGMRPLYKSTNGVLFVDGRATISLSDFTSSHHDSWSSSIINTTVKGGTYATSSRLGYRWFDENRAWVFGLNAGYDTREMATGAADTGVEISDSQTVSFQQIALGAEVISNTWQANAYALIPTGNVQQRLNSVYEGGALQTYGLDIGRNLTRTLGGSIGYFYQDGDHINGSGLRGRVTYQVSSGLSLGTSLSYDEAFDTRLSVDLMYRFGASPHRTIANRDVRVHDADIIMTGGGSGSTPYVSNNPHR